MTIDRYPNYALVVSIAKRYAGLDDWNDLVQVGVIALWEAEQRFDASRGLKFSTLASLVVNRAIMTHCNKTQRRSKKQIKQHQALSAARRALPDGSVSELAAESGLSIDTILELEHGTHHVVADLLTVELADPEDVNALLDCLQPADRRLVEMRYGVNSRDSMSLGEMSRATGISSSALNYRINEALRQVRYFHNLEEL